MLDDFLNIIVSPPQCGGRHLAGLISTYLNLYAEDEYLKYYNLIEKDISNELLFWFKKESYFPIRFCHGGHVGIADCLRAIDPIIHPEKATTKPRVFLITYPKTLFNTVAFPNRTKNWRNNRDAYMDATYYDINFLSTKYNIEQANIIPVTPEELFQDNIGTLLNKIYEIVPINIELCKKIHKIWFDKIKI